MEELSLHILDIVENSLEAGARRVQIRIRESRREDRLWIEIVDDGAGMGENEAGKASDPFFTTRTTRRVGLGLALLEQAAKAAGGQVRIESCRGAGTTVAAVFQYCHVDRQPLGNMEDTLLTLIAGHPQTEFEYSHVTEEGEASFSTAEIREQLHGGRLNSPEGLSALRKSLERLRTPADTARR